MSHPDEDEEAIASLLASRFRRPSTQPATPASDPAPEPDGRGDHVSPDPGHPTPLAIDELPEAPEPLRSRTHPPAPVPVEAATAIVGDERFLPIAEPMLVRSDTPGTLRIFVPEGSAVHVIERGRVAEIDEHLAGEVTIRTDGDRFYHYRRLLPSSVRVVAGDAVAPGDVIGMVGEAIDDDPPCLVVGLRSGDGTWADIHAELVGLADPGELGMSVVDDAGRWVDPLAGDGTPKSP